MSTSELSDPKPHSDSAASYSTHRKRGDHVGRGLGQRLQVLPAFCFLICLLAAFWNTADPHSTGNIVGIDWRVLLKVGVAGCAFAMGCWGFINSPRVRQALFGVPGIALVSLAGLFIATSAFALREVAGYSRATALINFGYVLFVPTAISILGLRRCVKAIVIGLTLHVIVAWVLYLFFPDVGVFEEELGKRTLISRMGGLGHPNGVGRNSILLGVLSLALLRDPTKDRSSLGRTILLCLIVASGLTVLATFSRTAMFAGLVAGGLLLADKIFTRQGIVIATILASMMVGGLIAGQLMFGRGLAKSALSAGTKTGDISELTSATGRTAIWAEAIKLIAKKPLTGYGLNASPVLLEDYSYHTHNAVLHASLSGGLAAGVLLICLLLWNLLVGLRSSEPIVRAISIFVLISGCFEDTILDTFASPTTILWMSVLLYPTIAARLQKAIQPSQESAYNESASLA